MMKYIKKGKKEPDSLREFRAGLKKEDYDRKDVFDELDKGDLKKSLLEEQGYICCYCMQRIDENNMKIEHWRAQSKHPKLKFDYQNLLATCKGNEGSPPSAQHCDTRKGYYEDRQETQSIDYDMTINPIDKNCEQHIKYCSNGKINFDNLSPAIKKDLEEVLNLNHETLVRNRKQTYKGVIKGMTQSHKKGKQVTWQYSFIKKKIQEHESKNKEGKYMEYCKIVVYLLKKRIGER